MPKPRLIIHIGMEKTGSSALQRFLSRNRGALRMMGVRYPRAWDADGVPCEKHRDIVDAIRAEAAGQVHPVFGPSADVVARYAEKARKARVTVLSAERLSGPSPAYARAFAPLAGAFALSVVVFLRRQDEWALSRYRQALIDGTERRPVETWLEDARTRARLDYDRMLGWWEALAGPGSVRMLRYPHDLPLIPAFIGAAGLPPSCLLLPGRGQRVNESVTDGVLVEALGDAAPALKPDLDQPARDRLLEGLHPVNERIRARYRPDLVSLFGMR